jgi:hypothetical protein
VSDTTKPSTTPGFIEALKSVADMLAALPSPSMVIGGVAVIACGVPRSTVDIDATVQLDEMDLEGLAGACAMHGLEPRVPDALAFAGRSQVYLTVHGPSGVAVDISLAWLPFEHEALEHSTAATYGSVAIRIPRPEDLLIYKLVASRPRDVDDAEQLLLVHRETMNLDRVRSVLTEFCEALEDESRMTTFEQLLHRSS